MKSIETREQVPERMLKGKKRPPSLKTLEKWVYEGYAKTPCGCKVEVDGHCKHGRASWLILLGYC